MASLINASTSSGGGIIASGDASGILALQTAGVTSVTIDTNQNVGIGTSSPASKLNVSGAEANTDVASTGQAYIQSTTAYNSSPKAGLQFGVKYNSSGAYIYGASIQGIKDNATDNNYSQSLVFTTVASGGSPAERARIDSSGNLLVGTTSTGLSGGPGIKFLSSTTESQVGVVTNTAVNQSIYHLYNVNATNNGYRFYVTVNGGIQNYSGNNGNLSDERTKTNIEFSGNYLDKICAIPVKLFNYKNEPEGEQRTLGVIAQDVELVAPELVSNEGFGETPEDGIPLKSIYQTDLQFALMKCIQEQQALITTLTERLTALENK